SGSIVAKRRAPSVEPTNVSAVEAASEASFQPLKAHISAGARRPSGRYSHCSGCIRLTVHDGLMHSEDATARMTPPDERTVARDPAAAGAATALPATTISGLRPGSEISGVSACTRKDRLTTRTGSSYLAL